MILAGKDLNIHNFENLGETKGCTAIVTLITNGTLYVANAGDGRCVMAMGGRAIALSTDHKPSVPSERQRILRAGSKITAEGRIDGNLNLSRSIGDLKYKNRKHLSAKDQAISAYPEIKSVPLSKVDFVVLGCDGIWETKTNQQIVDFIY